MIPAEAVEAAARAHYESSPAHRAGWVQISAGYKKELMEPMRAALEAAKRAIIKDTYWTHAEWPTDAELHASASHPAWEYQTTEGQRKRWDDADEPPEGEGWERNTDKGRDGWDRFDYTEESYWRRLKPEAERKEWQQYIPTTLRALAAIYADHPDYQEAWSPNGG